MKKLVTKTSTQKIYWDSENEIIWSELTASILTRKCAKEIIDAQEAVRDKLKKEKTRVLVVLGEQHDISREARQYLASARTCEVMRARALLTESQLSKLIANFFISVNKPKTPTRMFEDSDKAIKWLHTFSPA